MIHVASTFPNTDYLAYAVTKRVEQEVGYRYEIVHVTDKGLSIGEPKIGLYLA